jgi:hypothetical protein
MVLANVSTADKSRHLLLHVLCAAAAAASGCLHRLLSSLSVLLCVAGILTSGHICGLLSVHDARLVKRV